jgi:hypothetical protein
MKNIRIAVVGFSLLFTTAHSSDGSMTWSPIPAPHAPSLKPSPTLLSPESIAAAGLPATTHVVLATPPFHATSTYSEHALYNEESSIILRIPIGEYAKLSICSLFITDCPQSTVSFNAYGVLEWNTEHLACIEAARKAHAY